MLTVEGSNPSISILKFSLFQLSKFLHLDKNKNIRILVALLVLMIELVLTLIVIHSSFVGFKWNIDPKDHKSEEEYKAIAVEGAIWPKL